MRLRRLHVLLIIVALLEAALGTLDWLTSHEGPQFVTPAVRRAETDEAVVALTFDDGPRPPYTEQILDLLAEHDARATFFVVGENVEAHPQTVEAAMRLGHEIGNHSWSHERLIFRSPDEVREQIFRTDALLRQIGYRGPIPFRAPHGRKLFVLPRVLAETGRRHVLFDVYARDWERPPVSVIVDRILSGVRPGSIILLHDGGGDRSKTVAATEILLDELERRGYRFVTVSELLGDARPTSRRRVAATP